ncbi:transposase, partial [Cobetia marina]|uniref:transposase n=1 Tax=Cobetia marina TaxID=28258 RepID=UPI001583BBCE
LHHRNADRVETIVRGLAKRKGIRLYHFVNVGNHLHLVLKIDRKQLRVGRDAFQSFIRAATGLIARHVLRAERGSAKQMKFWQARPFTRLIAWGRDYQHVHRYMTKNAAQARGSFRDWGFSVTEPGKIKWLETG